MAEIVLTLLVRVATVGGFLICIGTIAWGAVWLSGGPWWPTVAFQTAQRGKLVHKLLWQSLLVAIIPSALIFGVSGLAAGVLFWLIFAPRWIGNRASINAWIADHKQTNLRQRALAVRNRRRELLGDALLDGTAAWPEYIIDAAKAERQRLYQERFERDGREDSTTVAPEQ